MAADDHRPRLDPPDPTRRSFLRGAVGTAAAAAALAGGASSLAQIARGAAPPPTAPREPHWGDIRLLVNGEVRPLRVRHERTLLLALREDLGLTVPRSRATSDSAAPMRQLRPRNRGCPGCGGGRRAGARAACRSAQLGSSVPMLDAEQKARGAARYTGDLGFHPDDPVQQPLVAKVLRSPFPHAEPIDIDDSDARSVAGSDRHVNTAVAIDPDQSVAVRARSALRCRRSTRRGAIPA